MLPRSLAGSCLRFLFQFSGLGGRALCFVPMELQFLTKRSYGPKFNHRLDHFLVPTVASARGGFRVIGGAGAPQVVEWSGRRGGGLYGLLL